MTDDEKSAPEPPGMVIYIVTAPIGPHCTVQTITGQIVRGHRIHPDRAWPVRSGAALLCDGAESDVVHVGRCVEARLENERGQRLNDDHGRMLPQPSDRGSGGMDWHIVPKGAQRVIVDAVPPPLPPTTRIKHSYQGVYQ